MLIPQVFLVKKQCKMMRQVSNLSYRVMRMRLQAANRGESPTTLLAQFKRIQQQTVQTEDGQSMNGITEINPAQKSLFNALELKAPTPNNLLITSL